jgi:hypothetical protein
MVVDLTEEEYRASNDPYSYEYFCDLMADKIGEYLTERFVIDDVVDMP